MAKIALATCSRLPQLDDDERRLLNELRMRGADVAPLVWTDPGGWDDVRLCVLRCVWDYHHQRERFLDWYEDLAMTAQVWNPLEVVRWNTDKTYLRDLAMKGIETVPTIFVEPGSGADVGGSMRARGWEEIVIKPAVSADGFETKRIASGDIAEGQRHLDELLARGVAMVQPFYPEVLAGGEHCVVVLDGDISHAVHKTSIFTPGFVDDPVRHTPTRHEMTFAHDVMDVVRDLGYETLYARVDIVEHDGVLALMELELTEPSLYYTHGGPDLSRFADKIESLAQAL